jgi:hypothetical protein
MSEGVITPYSYVEPKTGDILKIFKASIYPADGFTLEKNWSDIPVYYGKKLPSEARFVDERIRDRTMHEMGSRLVGKTGYPPKRNLGSPVDVPIKVWERNIISPIETGLLHTQVLYRSLKGGSMEKIPLMILLTLNPGDPGSEITV